MRYLIVVVILFGCGCATTTKWVGHPVTTRPDGYFSNEGYAVEYEIGFRSDGVVVWRKKP